MEGKRVLVTGASGGIGYQIALDLLQAGAIVGAHFRSNEASARRLIANSYPGQCEIFQADFSISSEVQRLWDEFIHWSQGVDALVNNAAEISTPMTLESLNDEAWDTSFQVNVKAPFILSRAALSIMEKQQSGRIVNMSSIGVKFGGGINTIHYSTAKSALEALTMSFAKAGAPSNVLVNAVRAGITNTQIHTQKGVTDLSDRTELIPLKRAASPSEIAKAVLFLLSDNSSFITGTTMTVAGGE